VAAPALKNQHWGGHGGPPLQNARESLDSKQLRPYSLPFRTEQSEANKQRPVGSVGVEALLDHALTVG
jgi:hypothetical protein